MKIYTENGIKTEAGVMKKLMDNAREDSIILVRTIGTRCDYFDVIPDELSCVWENQVGMTLYEIWDKKDGMFIEGKNNMELSEFIDILEEMRDVQDISITVCAEDTNPIKLHVDLWVDNAFYKTRLRKDIVGA